MSSNLIKGEILAKVRKLTDKLQMEYNTKFNVVLYTSIGRIVCDIEPPAPQSELVRLGDEFTSFDVDISAIFDTTSVFNAQLINIRNVIVYKHDSEEELMRTEQMILFADHIIGFSIKKQ